MTITPADSTNQVELDTDSQDLDNQRQSAIKAALDQNWANAIEINLSLLKHNNQDIDSLNRLGFSYLKSGKLKEAIKTYTKVKSIDPYNQIAIKNINRLSNIKNSDELKECISGSVSPMHFLEDPGKTKLVQCVNIAPNQVISTVHTGQEVYLKPKNHSIEVRDNQGKYLGALPDDLSFRLIKLLAANNKYAVFVKSVDKNTLSIFIRELERGKKYMDQCSFTLPTIYAPLTRSTSVDSDKPDSTATGENEEESDDNEA